MNIDPQEKIANNDSYFPELVHGKPVPRFGRFLKQICERSGLTQPGLEKKGQAKYRQWVLEGRIIDNSTQGSMLQQAISQVVLGRQQASYLQTLVWITVLEEHYNDALVIGYFKKKGLEIPVFTPEIKAALWALSGYQPPENIQKAINDFATFDHVPRRLPRGTDVTPRTDADLRIAPPRQDPHSIGT